MTATAPPLAEADAKAALFTQIRRGQEGATRIRFLNNGGRSQLMQVDVDGTTVRLAPVFHRNIAAAVVEAAHDYAKAAYGARRNWPSSITVTADDDAADA